MSSNAALFPVGEYRRQWCPQQKKLASAQMHRGVLSMSGIMTKARALAILSRLAIVYVMTSRNIARLGPRSTVACGMRGMLADKQV